MINKLHIKNFKSHKDSEINLGKLTVLTGINGCGKTSVIQALLLLRQSFMKGRLADGLDLNKPLCNIGIGNDALSRYADEGIISFDLSSSDGEKYTFSFNVNELALTDSFLKKLKYSDNTTSERLESLPIFNNNFQYISAARWGGVSIFPKETYAVETQRQISLELGQAELVAQYLYKFGDQIVADYSNGDLSDLTLIHQVEYWEQRISPNLTLHVEQGKDNNSYSISYGYNGKGVTKPLHDLKAENVGYGISYTLPVIVALISAKPGALVIIENPEAHLHPAGQSELAKLITMVAASGVQVMVETHSDHIITGIQLACKANSEAENIGIRKDDVSVYYFHSLENNTLQIEAVHILDNGKLDYQPKGFFDQAEKDMFDLYSI